MIPYFLSMLIQKTKKTGDRICQCGHYESAHAMISTESPCGIRFCGCSKFTLQSKEDDKSCIKKR